MKKHISIIGSGFSSLSAACYLAQSGHRVQVYEKNTSPGGRARQLKKDGFVFDIGPSWYWMPDVFEKFFGGKDSIIALSILFKFLFKKGRSLIFKSSKLFVIKVF